MKYRKRTLAAKILGLLLLASMGSAAACGAGFDGSLAEDNAGSGGSTGVGQSGAQDFGRFRGIIEDGELPAPNTLDQVGFFNEHKIELPEADCGEQVCLHGMLGVQGNMINGSNCTVVLVGFNTPLDPEEFERPPLNMAIAVDVSGSMAGMPIDSVRAGLRELAENLDPKDTVTLVAYSTEAEILIDSTPETDPDRALLKQEIEGIAAQGDTNIYSGLKEALEAVDARRENNRQNRVILLSDGVATSGIQNTDRIVNLGRTYAEKGIGITTIGVGQEFDQALMGQLAENGAGNFYFLEDVGAVEEVFTEEIQTFMVPLAEDVRISFETEEAYEFRAVYGSRTWESENGRVDIDVPALFMAGRQSVDDIGPGNGRRGGGGMILLEIVPTTDQDIIAETGAGAVAGNLKMVYRKPGTEQDVEQEVEVINPLEPGVTPEEGEFEQPSVEKAFVALNIFAGFEMAIERANNGSGNAALNVLNPLVENVEGWLEENDDADIEDDLETMKQLVTIIEEDGGRETVGAPPNPWPND